MLSTENMKYSLKNLMLRKSRSFLTILSIFLGIATIFIFISFGLGLYSYVNNLAAESGADKLYVQARGIGAPGSDTTFKLEDDDVRAIEKTQGVKNVLPAFMKPVQVEFRDSKKYVYSMGYEPTSTNVKLMGDLISVDIFKGRDLKSGDSGKVVLGYNYQFDQKIFPNGLELGNKIIIEGVKFEVVGFYESVGNPADDSNIYMVDKDLDSIFPNEKLSFAIILIQATSSEDVSNVRDAVQKNLRKERGQEEGKEDFFVQTYEDVIAQFGAALNIIIGFIVLIALISVVVSAVNTANTMVTSVLERTKEIGIMKAIGATSSTIRNIFLFESAILGLVAGIIGVSLGFIFSYFAGQALLALGWGFLMPKFTVSLFVGLIFFAVFVGTVSGVIVAIQASKMNVVDALRYE